MLPNKNAVDIIKQVYKYFALEYALMEVWMILYFFTICNIGK